MTLWQGRFSTGPSDELMAFTESLSIDRQLWKQDIQGSLAHVAGLEVAGILSESDVAVLISALHQVESEMTRGDFIPEGDEDIHSAVERRVTEIAGDIGAKLHTGRSRNDQIATDMRLFVKSALVGVSNDTLALAEVLGDLAEAAGDAYLPGYTHTQRAQPVLVAHHMLAHGWALLRDLDRMADAYRRTDVSPLGAGALGGSTLPLQPDFVAAQLGFGSRFQNSLDAVSDRDFVAETLFVLATIGIHLSRIGEEIVIWSTEEFGFVRLDDAYSTGSSMLPHKKNPDIAELARGKTGRLVGNLTAFLVTLKGLPLSYNRDLQEDKEPLFDSIKTITLALKAISGMLSSASFDFARMRQAADSEALVAIDLAEFLVLKGVPFRRAHGIVGGIVRDSIERRVPVAELVAAHPQLGPEAADIVAPGGAIRRRMTPGGSGKEAVSEQMRDFKERVGLERKRINDLL
ncbi:MAG: argininosuccinate lyase [Acidimicrobiaceae bacterium]|nr:argininosuccinate lyase [Acidimicrobiaceae bacterium]